MPPAIFTAQVRALLLEAEAPLPGGRHVVHGCPECAGLGCGAVTAVIERDGDDYVWRDFAWQTEERADLDLNGCHGTGPFRFRGEEYRAAPRSLLDDTDPRTARRRVLLTGARVALLAAALRTLGIGAGFAHDAEQVPPEELRGYGAVAFGRAAGPEARAAVRRAFARAGVDVAHVDGLAPIVPLLVAQIEHALDPTPAERRRPSRWSPPTARRASWPPSPCRVVLTAHRLDRPHRTRTRALFDGVPEPGHHRIPLDTRAVKGESVVARTTGSVPVEAMTR
ncbi:hypothetical protein SGLAM104S_09937 [Streptomyces glaucescens]